MTRPAEPLCRLPPGTEYAPVSPSPRHMRRTPHGNARILLWDGVLYTAHSTLTPCDVDRAAALGYCWPGTLQPPPPDVPRLRRYRLTYTGQKQEFIACPDDLSTALSGLVFARAGINPAPVMLCGPPWYAGYAPQIRSGSWVLEALA